MFHGKRQERRMSKNTEFGTTTPVYVGYPFSVTLPPPLCRQEAAWPLKPPWIEKSFASPRLTAIGWGVRWPPCAFVVKIRPKPKASLLRRSLDRGWSNPQKPLRCSYIFLLDLVLKGRACQHPSFEKCSKDVADWFYWLRGIPILDSKGFQWFPQTW